jgi:hypothetical protein
MPSWLARWDNLCSRTQVIHLPGGVKAVATCALLASRMEQHIGSDCPTVARGGGAVAHRSNRTGLAGDTYSSQCYAQRGCAEDGKHGAKMLETNEQSPLTFTLNLLAGSQGIPQSSMIWQHFGNALTLSLDLDISKTYKVLLHQEPNRAILLSWVSAGDIVGFVCYDAENQLLWGYPA